MKNFLKIYLIFIFFFPLFSNGQSEYFDNNPIWRISSGCGISNCIGTSCLSLREYNYYINGDTIVNSHSYKKVYRKGTDWFEWLNSPPAPSCCQGSNSYNDSINPIVLVRDSLRKIFVISTSGGNQESLLYDFNLLVGDTLPLTFNNYDPEITVLSIDSILINNAYRKVFHLNSSNGFPHPLIEGIGHYGGFIELINFQTVCNSQLLCYGYSDSAFFPTNNSICNINIGINDIMNRSFGIYVYPNPFNDKLNVTSSSTDKKEILVYDLFSRKVAQKVFSNSTSIQTDELPNGIYIYEVRNESGRIKSGKIIKQ